MFFSGVTEMPFRNRKLDRRSFLRGSGVAIALPLLGAMTPARAAKPTTTPRRFVAICGGLGFHAPFLFPSTPGSDYELTPYLQKIGEHRDKFSLFSGLSHPQQNGNNGHASSMTWLTSAPRPGLAGFKNTISLDQLIAGRVGAETRIPYLCLSNDGGSLSWTSNGINIPADSSPAKVYRALFIDGTEKEVAEQMRQLRRGRSILDTAMADARRLRRSLGPVDQQKLDEYFSSVRDLEQRIIQNEEWASRAKPHVDYALPEDVADRRDIVARQRLMYDIMVLALQTDSTRTITLSLGSMNAVPSNIPGVQTDWHNLSHHGKDHAKIEELKLIEEAEFAEFGRFLAALRTRDENGATLLDSTAVLFGSNLGNASAHDWHNLPIIVAGGGYRHGQYIAHDAANNTPLANLFVALAQRMGIDTDRFGSSTAQTVRGLEV
jgi:hypothetical protein